MTMRIGQGFDVHALVAGRPLIIGGVTIPHDKGLLGHSDADVLLHAICDALLGAAAMGDIGRHFPDTDPAYKGADSRVLLRRVLENLSRNALVYGYAPGVANIPVLGESTNVNGIGVVGMGGGNGIGVSGSAGTWGLYGSGNNGGVYGNPGGYYPQVPIRSVRGQK